MGIVADLARSVSLHYPKSLLQAVLLAETMELAVKASRRPNWKSNTAGNPAKVQGVHGQRGGGRGGYFLGRGISGSRGGFGGRVGIAVDSGMSPIGDEVETEV